MPDHAVIWFYLDNNPAVARFLTPEERRWAVERLRSNNTGVETSALIILRINQCSRRRGGQVETGAGDDPLPLDLVLLCHHLLRQVGLYSPLGMFAHRQHRSSRHWDLVSVTSRPRAI